MDASSNKPIEQAAEQLGVLLAQRGWRVSCAESCTGGGIAQAITAIAGSSGWFDLGLVTYSNAMKQALLGVTAGTLQQHGAVSEPVVREMALGALIKSNADIAVSTSGIAGPGGGTATKPVGTVCFAWGTRQSMIATTQQFSGSRAQVRQAAVYFALQQLLKCLHDDSF